jgi:hypothetical protein
VWVWFKPASHLEELRLQSRQRFRSKGASQLIRWNAAPRQAGSLPDQRFIKSRDPVGSDFALSGATALPASGKLGAAGAIGPISEISRFTMPRAGRPVNTLVITVSSSAAFVSAARWSAGTSASGQNK